MLNASHLIRPGDPDVRLTRYHLEGFHFSLILVMPDENYLKRKWWQFWEPKYIVEKSYSFLDSSTGVAHLTESDYAFYRTIVAKRNEVTTNGS